ncbi:MAG: hypothetical protein AAGI37_09145 [Planctomycetota bacterium]
MEAFDLSRNEWIVLGVVAFVAVVIPSWIKSISNRRRYGYQKPQHGYSVGSVMVGIVPAGLSMFAFFAVSGFLIGFYRDQIPDRYMPGVYALLFVADIGALAIGTQLFLPKGYINHLDNTAKGMHSPLDWLVGLVLAVCMVGGGVVQYMLIVSPSEGVS